MASVFPGVKPKHILLQQERLITHDKTWLPARLQPPKLTDSIPYAVYLGQYEQYLAALRYMKARFLASRRADATKRLVYSTRCEAVVFAAPDMQSRGAGSFALRQAPSLVFGTIEEHLADMSDASVPMPRPGGPQTPEPKVVPIAPVFDPTKKTTSEAKQQARKAAKKARRKARRVAKAEEKTLEMVKANAEKAKAETTLIQAKDKLIKAKARLAKGGAKAVKTPKHVTPSKLRRKERRALARQTATSAVSAPPPPT
jgi:hypothetical protein